MQGASPSVTAGQGDVYTMRCRGKTAERKALPSALPRGFKWCGGLEIDAHGDLALARAGELEQALR